MGKSKRTENGFREVQSYDGSFSPHIGRKTAERLTRMCRLLNKNRTRFVEECINEALDRLEQEYLNGLSKEVLIEMIKQKWSSKGDK